MPEPATPDAGWAAYLARRRASPGPIRPTLQRALAAGAAEGPARLALDLGCGAGHETRCLLDHGWSVLALDQEPAALRHLLEQVDPAQLPRLTTLLRSFERLPALDLPPCDLVNASHSLPFCPPAHFAALWQKIVATLKPGGRFAGHFFGERDDWATNATMTFHRLDQLEELFAGLRVEWFEEEEFYAAPALGPPKHWHVISVLATKPADFSAAA